MAQQSTAAARDTSARSSAESSAKQLERVRIVAERTARKAYSVSASRTATKTVTPLRDTPQSISVVTSGLIADQAMQGMADVVRYVPGITMGQGEGHRDAPTIRGQSSSADFFVDGVRDDGQYLRDLYNVDRVEAFNGPNAMMFGRGGGGGVINRVTKEPAWSRVGAIGLEGGSFDHKRTTLDLGRPFGDRAAVRLNALHENSGGFRRAMRLQRIGVDPEVGVALGAQTTARVGFEHFSDSRTVDRGIPSFQGRPLSGDVTRFFGDPDVSVSRARVDAANVTLSHRAGSGISLRNHTYFAAYDKFYQNVYPGSAVNAAGSQLSLAAYNSSIGRSNVFSQTDLTAGVATGPLRHTLLLGAEIGRQGTNNFRSTGYFNNSTTSTSLSVEQPTIAAPVTFRQSATDADNHVVASVAAAYIQDQLALGAHLQAIAGLRVDRFAVRFHNNRGAAATADLERADRLVSPRLGLVLKPVEALSLYASQSVSYLPGSGDQFSSLTVTSQTLEPEQFINRELGAKWDVRPDVALTAAVYRLDRSNGVAPAPSNPATVVQTGSQRSTGLELGAAGTITPRWQLAAGFTAQRSRIVNATTAAKSGATAPLVPERTAFLWNKLVIARAFSIGLGMVRQGQSFAAIDNTVVLPAFTRFDGGVFFRVTRDVHAQVNVENVTNRLYYPTSHGNNNIMPGAPRSVKLSLNAGL